VAFLTPESGIWDPGWVKKSGSGSRMNNPDHNSESLETIFWVEILKFRVHPSTSWQLHTTIFDTGSQQQCCGSGMFIPDPDFYRSRLLDLPDPGSRIPDPKTATIERGEKSPEFSCF
jgi:hypothetical protein